MFSLKKVLTKQCNAKENNKIKNNEKTWKKQGKNCAPCIHTKQSRRENLQRSAVREAGVSRHHGELIECPS